MQNQKNSNLFLWISLVIMTAIIIGGVGLYYYFLGQADSLKDNGKNYTVITSTTKKTTETTTADETANWNSYTVEDLGISFQYPKEWGGVNFNFSAVSPEVGSGKTGRITFSDKSTRVEDDYKRSVLYAGYVTTDFSVGRESNLYEAGSVVGAYQTKSCDELKKIKGFEEVANCQFIKTQNGNQGVVFNITMYESSFYTTVGYYFTENKDYPLFGIEYISPNDSFGDNLPIFLKVIESINTNSETSSWQNYTNEEYGFKFGYPKNYNLVDESQFGNNIIFKSTDTTGSGVNKTNKYVFSIKVEPTSQSLEDLAKSWLDGEIFNSKMSDTKVDGKNAKEVVNSGTALGAGTYSACLVVYNGYKFEVTANDMTDNDTLTKTDFEKILNTFKFVK